MFIKIFLSLNLIEWYVLLTFVLYCFFYLKGKKKTLLGLILLASWLNEMVNIFLIANNFLISINSNIYIIVHHSLWMILLVNQTSFVKIKYALIGCFVLFGLLDFCFIEGTQHFNCAPFVLGSLLYLAMFIQESFLQIQKDNLEFFQTTHFLLLAAPVLFFLGFSFVFGFSSKTLNSTRILGSVSLYSFISYFVNIVYYSLIIVYLYLEKPTVKHV